MSGLSKAGRLVALFLFSLAAAAAEPGLLFRVSADTGFAADVAGGDPVPNFQDKVKIVPTGKFGGAIEWADDGVLTWHAPGNIYAQRGTLSFFWRSRYPVGVAPFVLFRVGYADHTSWDMTWLRIDWNGHGFDAFVTDANLARTRVSFKVARNPAPDSWSHVAFSWDERVGIRLYLDGKEAARQDAVMDLDTGLDQFGLAARVVSPHQVQSRYSYLRGGDYDEIRIYDHMLSADDIAGLVRNRAPATAKVPDQRQAWLRRWGWDRAIPPLLTAPATRIRKVEFADAKDKKQWMFKATDGIQETTWPGVYNRSRLPGRNDYFQLPDWLTYVEGGQALDLALPDEDFNRIEIRGAAFGELAYAPPGGEFAPLARRPQGELRSVYAFERRHGGRLRFTNVEQETPIQEIWAYDVSDGKEPDGTLKLSYTIHAEAAPDYDNLAALRQFIAGRYPPAERSTVVALPNGAQSRKRAVETGFEPFVHILIPAGFADPPAAQPVTRSWAYGWENIHDGLDGIAIDLPAIAGDDAIPLNIQVKDPIWPERDMIDVSVALPPGQARTVWLDLRDRILTNDSFYLTIASAKPDFSAGSLDGARIRLVFKDREQAKVEHVADRFNQVKDNWGYLVEEHTASKRERLYLRCFGDIADLLRVDPEHQQGRYYWSEMSYNNQGWPAFKQPEAPAGVPLWAFRQLEDLKLVRRFVNWWIDERQVPFGDFGGGISDDTDLLQQWPGLALMGVDPDKITRSHDALVEAVYKDDMFTDGLSTIVTDELHSYEDGINSNSQSLYLNWGKPKTVERLMETARAFHRIILPNPKGHLLFASNWFSGTTIYREGPWEWQKPYSFTILHPAILLGMYNGQPDARALIEGLADSYLAHGRMGKDGVVAYPNEINWRSEEERGGELVQGSGENAPMHTFWAAWRWTNDPKYLSPIFYRVARKGEQSILDLTENVIDVLGKREDWGRKLLERAAVRPGGFEQYAAWQLTGDRRWLEALHAHGIQEKTQRMHMITEGHWWIDRVEARADLLQRERLGGVALERGWLYPGHSVSWRFRDPEGAVQVAILVPTALAGHLRIVAYNTSDQPQQARMTGWNVTAGQWRMSVDGAAPSMVALERSAAVDVTFAPRRETVLEFTLDHPTTPVEERPDLGIGPDDVAMSGDAVAVTVHSLGSVPVPGGTLILTDASGAVVASAAVPPMPAPLDLLPRTVRLKLAVPAGTRLSGARVKVALPGDAPEVTLLNNEVILP
jgi:hypothetical protein